MVVANNSTIKNRRRKEKGGRVYGSQMSSVIEERKKGKNITTGDPFVIVEDGFGQCQTLHAEKLNL